MKSEGDFSREGGELVTMALESTECLSAGSSREMSWMNILDELRQDYHQAKSLGFFSSGTVDFRDQIIPCSQELFCSGRASVAKSH